ARDLGPGPHAALMALRTPICELFEIEHPVFLAGMGEVAFAEVVAAVSEAGGYGTLCVGAAPPGRIPGSRRPSQGRGARERWAWARRRRSASATRCAACARSPTSRSAWTCSR